jgi:hypothetical protein
LTADIRDLWLADVTLKPNESEVRCCTHANFPWSPVPTAPITRIGWETRELLARCIDCLDAQRRGESVAPITLLPPVFEHELHAAPADVASS